MSAANRGTKDKLVSSVGKQDYGTPIGLVNAIEIDFGFIEFDLAASKENTLSEYFYDLEANSLTQDWLETYQSHKDNIADSQFLWLNPPFERVRPWMEKCRDEAARGARILSLTKASIDSNWYQEVVAPNAASWILKQRVKFVGKDDVFTQALMLTEWGTGKRGLGFWDWKRK